MPTPQQPAPILDQPPASPEGLGATQPGPEASMQALAPTDAAQAGGQMQLVEMTLKVGQGIGQGLDILGQLHPQFLPLASQMTAMLKEGLRLVLEQGLGPSEPAPGQPGQANPMSGLAPMSRGMPMPEEGSQPAF